MSDNEDRCQRCGEDGEDRRTLWMAAMYDLMETDIPLQHVRVTGRYAEQTGEEIIPGRLKLRAPVFTEAPDVREHEHRFYTLRVCKECRAEWMLALRSWFQEKGNHGLTAEAESRVRPGMIQMDGQVPVRVFGATISVPPTERTP